MSDERRVEGRTQTAGPTIAVAGEMRSSLTFTAGLRSSASSVGLNALVAQVLTHRRLPGAAGKGPLWMLGGSGLLLLVGDDWAEDHTTSSCRTRRVGGWARPVCRRGSR